LPLTWAVIIGTLPGVFIGAWIRLEYLPGAKNFKFFAGFVLLYIAIRLLIDTLQNKNKSTISSSARKSDFIVSDSRFSFRQVAFRFDGEQYAFSLPGVFLLCFIVWDWRRCYPGAIFYHTISSPGLCGSRRSTDGNVYHFNSRCPDLPGSGIYLYGYVGCPRLVPRLSFRAGRIFRYVFGRTMPKIYAGTCNKRNSLRLCYACSR